MPNLISVKLIREGELLAFVGVPISEATGELYNIIKSGLTGVSALNGLTGSVQLYGSGQIQVLSTSSGVYFGYTGTDFSGTNIQVTGGAYLNNANMTGIGGTQVFQSGNNILISGINTGQLNSVFYPLVSNPSGYLTSGQTGILANKSELNSTGSTLLNLININSGNIGVTGLNLLSQISSLNNSLNSTGNNLLNLINVNSGNIGTTGLILRNQINSLSGYITGNLWKTNITCPTGILLQAVIFPFIFSSKPFIFTQLEANSTTSGDWTYILVSGASTTGFFLNYGESFTQTGYSVNIRVEI